MRKRKSAELVGDIASVRDCGKQSTKVILDNSLWEEGNNPEKSSHVTTKLLEHGGNEREFDYGGEALLVLSLQHTRLLFFPFPSQSIRIPLVLTCGCGEQGD